MRTILLTVLFTVVPYIIEIEAKTPDQWFCQQRQCATSCDKIQNDRGVCTPQARAHVFVAISNDPSRQPIFHPFATSEACSFARKFIATTSKLGTWEHLRCQPMTVTEFNK